MSEFKFACPVCGQHMMCDESQGGSVMECPTCFQKITAPQAPTKDSKFILTGTKVSTKKISVRGFDPAPAVPPPVEKEFPTGIFIVAAFAAVLVAGAVVFYFHQHRRTPLVETPVSSAPVVKPVVTEAEPAKPVVLAPPASDTNWTLNLNAVTIPEATVAGRIHGQDFITERTGFQNGVLTLRAGTKGPVEFGVLINFGGALPEALAGQTINVSPDAEKAATVNLRWKENSETQKQSFNTGYAMRLEFGVLAKNRLPGKIYLCVPDAEKSYLMGSFNAAIFKPKPKVPK